MQTSVSQKLPSKQAAYVPQRPERKFRSFFMYTYLYMEPHVDFLANTFTGKLNLDGWEKYATNSDYVYDSTPVIGLQQDASQKNIDGEAISVGVFYYHGIPAYIAWGLKSAEHCGFHATLASDETVGEMRLGCPDIVPTKNETGEVMGFVLDGQEVFSR